MVSSSIPSAISAVTDGQDRLLEAQEPLAQLQLRCGGILPGVLAVPELFELVRHARLKGLRLAREFHAFDGYENVSGFVRVSPVRSDGEAGCELMIENWRQDEYREEDEQIVTQRLDAVDQMVAELNVRLDKDLNVLTASAKSSDLAQCASDMNNNVRQHWSNFIELSVADYHQPLHWRLVDGSRAIVKGSTREWRIRLLPIGSVREEPEGFQLLLISETPWLVTQENEASDGKVEEKALMGDALTRVLRQPISRIISNAETIKARLAGPLRDEYANYAGDISSAGNHLLALIEDLADLEVVENSNFNVLDEVVNLAEVAKRAIGILGRKSQDKNITIRCETRSAEPQARGELRRILQILINLIGNAINYSPDGTTITVTIYGGDADDALPSISVRDQGAGIPKQQLARVFTKFERLGREGDGGTGLGLYISQKLANAMKGQLSVNSVEGEGATFVLELPKV